MHNFLKYPFNPSPSSSFQTCKIYKFGQYDFLNVVFCHIFAHQKFTARVPNLSNSCGLHSPSSGLPEPTITNWTGCPIEITSHSTTLIPEAAESIGILTQ
jgi:hypothetical protein